jgi:dihydroorotate dehydrogenase electron transfer subunit
VNTGYATVTESRRLYGDIHETWFGAHDLANGAYPGQFIMLRCSDDLAYNPPPKSDIQHLPSAIDADPLLPRPMSFYRVRKTRGGPEWGILYDVVGRGTAWLANRKSGDRVYAWGPLGRGYEIGRNAQNLLLVAGGIGVAPLVWLAEDACARGLNVTMIIGARNESLVYPASMLPPQVEIVVTTDDGSAGRRGLVTEPFAELLEWCDQAFACGPTVMMQAMAGVARKSRIRRPVQVLLEERMGCGTGICYGCAVDVRVRGGRSMKLVCKDGPRFDIRDVW